MMLGQQENRPIAGFRFCSINDTRNDVAGGHMLVDKFLMGLDNRAFADPVRRQYWR
jgi:hypothetical protein